MKKYVAEAIGTFVLTFLGCGAAVSLGCAEDNTAAVVGTAIAFGLAVVAMAYTIGGVSGCHINPAITLACFIDKRISAKDCCGYICGQLVGGIVAGACLAAIYCCTSGLGANGIGAGCHGSVTTALVVEAILTALFVLVVLGSTDSKVGAGNFAGLAIGLSCIGSGIAVGSGAPAAIGATSEDPKNFVKALIFVVLGEGIALYGLLISILIISNIGG